MPQEVRCTSPSSSGSRGSRVSLEHPCVVERAGTPQRRLQKGNGARRHRSRLPQPKGWQQSLHPALHLQPPNPSQTITADTRPAAAGPTRPTSTATTFKTGRRGQVFIDAAGPRQIEPPAPCTRRSSRPPRRTGRRGPICFAPPWSPTSRRPP
uniref:Uncharacterized protein n=1 Tax=Triticum urartu TaxID=4572 RepID=A0A8R7QUS6_TRIUA